MIDCDVSCRSCGYNLRGLEASGVCPECAASVQSSLAPEELVSADPNQLRNVRIGLRFALLGEFLAIGVAGVFLALFLPGMRHFRGDVPMAIVSGIGVSLLVFLAGVIVATPPERTIDSRTGTRRIRRFVRVCAACALALEIIIATAMISDSIEGNAIRFWSHAVTALLVLFVIAIAALSVAFPLWMNELLRRASTGTPEESASVASWLAIIGSVFVVALVISKVLFWVAIAQIALIILLPVSLAYYAVALLATWRSGDAVAYDERLARERASHTHGVE